MLHTTRLALATAIGAMVLGASSVQAASAWETDFAGGGTTLADFTGTGEGQFDSIGTKGLGSPTVTFNDATDVIELRETDYPEGSDYPYAGIGQTDFGLGDLNIARYSLTITPYSDNARTGKRGLFQVGQPAAWDTNSSTFGKFSIYYTANGIWFENNQDAGQTIGADGSELLFGQTYTIDILAVNNREDAGVAYSAPGGGGTVDLGTMHIYLDGAALGTFTAVGGRENAYFKGIELNIGGYHRTTTASVNGIDVNSLAIYDSLDLISAPAVLLGDANNDGVVSADDFAAVQTNFGNTGAADGLLPGDANDDGVVSADDFAAIQTNFGNVLGSAAEAAPVPEPATMALLAIGGLAATFRGRRRVQQD